MKTTPKTTKTRPPARTRRPAAGTTARDTGGVAPAIRKTKALTARRGKALAIKRRKRHPNRPLTEAQIRLLLNEIGDIRDDALIRLGLSVGLRVSEVVGIRTSEVDFERGLIKIWDEKKDLWRFIMPTNEALGAIRKYLNSLEKQPKTLFPISSKKVERLIHGYSKKALGFIISWHSLRTTYVSRSGELAQSPAVVMANTGDSAATILKYRCVTLSRADLRSRRVEATDASLPPRTAANFPVPAHAGSMV